MTALTVVLMFGMLTVSAVLVIRLSVWPPGHGASAAGAAGGLAAPPPVAAAEIVLPEGARVEALGRAGPELMVLTREADGGARLRVFDAETGAPRSVTAIRRE